MPMQISRDKTQNTLGEWSRKTLTGAQLEISWALCQGPNCGHERRRDLSLAGCIPPGPRRTGGRRHWAGRRAVGGIHVDKSCGENHDDFVQARASARRLSLPDGDVGRWLRRCLQTASEMSVECFAARAPCASGVPCPCLRCVRERADRLSCARPRTDFIESATTGRCPLGCWGAVMSNALPCVPFREAAPYLFDKSAAVQRFVGLKSGDILRHRCRIWLAMRGA